MAQQDEGWPLGLQPVLNARIELARNGNNSGSASFNTLVTASPSSSTDSSSDLDTQSTGSFFLDNSTTLGSLMGVSSIVELSRRSQRRSKTELVKIKKDHKKNKLKYFMSRLFCLTSSSRSTRNNNQKNMNAPISSLGQYLEVERRASNYENRRISESPLIYGPDDELALALAQEPNSLFENGNIAPPNKSIFLNPRHRNINGTERKGMDMELGHNNNGFGSLRQLFSCIC